MYFLRPCLGPRLYVPLCKRKAEGLIFRDAGQPNTDQRRGAAALDIDPWVQFSGAVALDTGPQTPFSRFRRFLVSVFWLLVAKFELCFLSICISYEFWLHFATIWEQFSMTFHFLLLYLRSAFPRLPGQVHRPTGSRRALGSGHRPPAALFSAFLEVNTPALEFPTIFTKKR